MTKKSRRRNQTRNDPSEKIGKEVDSTPSPISKDRLLIAGIVVALAYAAFPLFAGVKEAPLHDKIPIFNAEDFTKSVADTIEERLLDEWQPGDAVTIKAIEEGNQGLFATRDIQKGQVIARIQYPDLESEISREYPFLKAKVQSSLNAAVDKHDGRAWSTLTTGKILSLLKFLMEDDAGEESIWYSFIETIPRNMSKMAWYWSEDEMNCVVDRPNFKSLSIDLQVYHTVMDAIKEFFPPLAEIYTRERVEWAYLMLKTRGFGQYFLPVLHLANHNPLEAVPAFLIPTADTAVYVASQKIKAGDPVYTNYGAMTPVLMAEQYGFVDAASVYFEVPSILDDFLQSERTMYEPLCNSEPVRFYGSVPTKTVGATFKNAGHSTYFKAFMPDERSYACIRVFLQTENGPDVAGYIAEKLELDYNRYKAMENATHCRSNEGNFPLIRKANQVTARLMWGALDVANQGKEWKIAYPDIPTYKMNHA